MNTATVTARPYTDPDAPEEPGLALSGPAADLAAIVDELPTAGALGLDHDLPFTGLRCAPSDRREVHVWRALRGAAPGEVEAGVRAAASAAGVSLEVVS